MFIIRLKPALYFNADHKLNVETKLFDVRDFDLPQDDYGTAIGKDFPEWRDAIVHADGLVVPEYNHGYPGGLKSVLDLLLKEYIHKAVGLVAVFPPDLGAERAWSKRACQWSEN